MTQMRALLAAEEYGATPPVRSHPALRIRDWLTRTWPPGLNCPAPLPTDFVWAPISLVGHLQMPWLFMDKLEDVLTPVSSGSQVLFQQEPAP